MRGEKGNLIFLAIAKIQDLSVKNKYEQQKFIKQKAPK